MRRFLVLGLLLLAGCELGASPQPSGGASSASPTQPALASGAGLTTIDAAHARLVSAVVALVSAYNAGDLDAVLSLVGERVVWADCDYRAQNVIGLHQPASHSELSAFLRDAFADHDRLEISSVSFATGEQPGSVGQAVSVAYGRRTSDTIRSLGFTNGILGPRATKIAFSAGRIVSVSNASFPVSGAECRPVAAN